MAARLTIDPQLCIGSTECNRIAPAAFELDEETGVSVPLPAADTVDLTTLRRAAEACPTQAISIVAGDGDDAGEDDA